MSKITVTTIAGLTSGGDANTVKIESGDAFNVVSGVTTLNGGVVLNENSADVDFRVESDANTHALFLEGSTGNIGIGTSSPPSYGSTFTVLQANNTASGIVQANNSTNSVTTEIEAEGTRGAVGTRTNHDFVIKTNQTERARIDSSGNLHIGRTSAGDTGNGHSIRGGDSAIFSRDASGETMQVCRNNDNGEIIRFKKNGATVGNIGTDGGKLRLNSDGNNNLFLGTNGTTRIAIDSVRMYPYTDNNYDLGLSSNRYDDIFATNSTIQTSDQNEKQDIANATTKELNVAKKLSALFKTFKWKDKVAEKGDKARTHTGIVAQEVQLAFKEEGLDASNYGLFTSDTWKNDDGKEQTRLGVRYPELFSFIFSSIESRLTALESK